MLAGANVSAYTGRNLLSNRAFSNKSIVGGSFMGRGLLLWLIGIPIPIILLIWLFGGLH